MPTPTLNLRLDRPFSLLHPDEPCHLVARLLAPRPERTADAPPLDLALVLDASGSMSGAPLAAAHEAVLRIADELSATTRLTVLSFADDVVVHIDGVVLDGHGRAEVRSRLADLRTRGSTNLHAGWQAGCALLDVAAELADEAGAQGGSRRRQVVVLSDGCANQGIVAPEDLAPRARAMLARGIVTSCVGVGDGYSPAQMTALAEHGGGSCHDAKDALEIVEILRGEVLSLAAVVAEDLQLELELSDRLCATELSGMPTSGDRRQLVVHLGALREGVERVAVVRVEDREAAEPLVLEPFDAVVTATMSWREPGQRERSSGAPVVVPLERARDRVAPIVADAREVLEAWLAGVVRRVTDWNRDGAWHRIEELWRVEFEPFVAYARWHAETEGFVATIGRVRHGAARPMHERARKAAWDMASKMARKEPVHYSRERGTLRSLFDDGAEGGAS